jgi:pyridoxine 4-dehydrogenase
VVLSVKGAFDASTMTPDGTPEAIKRSLDNCIKDLQGLKKIDIFECARVDPKVPLETSLKYLETNYVKTGLIGGIGMSEVKAETLRKAAKITTIASVEVELSLWSTDVLENGVAAACAELNIPLVAYVTAHTQPHHAITDRVSLLILIPSYSPIGKGMLTGQIKSLDDLPPNDMRRHYPRFQPDTFPVNLQLVDELQRLAKDKGCTPAQLAINWVKSLSGRKGMPEIIPIPGATTDARVRENAEDHPLTEDELGSIDAILAKFPVVGGRYPPFVPIEG